MNDILSVSELNKSYGDFSLKNITFSLPGVLDPVKQPF